MAIDKAIQSQHIALYKQERHLERAPNANAYEDPCWPAVLGPAEATHESPSKPHLLLAY